MRESLAIPVSRLQPKRCSVLRKVSRALILITALSVAGCGAERSESRPVDDVDIKRLMGEWYVIANTPTFIEKSAHNAVEPYSLNEDGTIATIFAFRDGDYEAEIQEYRSRGG